MLWNMCSKRCEGDVDARGRLMIKTIWDANEESSWLHHSLVHRQSDMHFMQPRYATITLTRHQSNCRTVARLSVFYVQLCQAHITTIQPDILTQSIQRQQRDYGFGFSIWQILFAFTRYDIPQAFSHSPPPSFRSPWQNHTSGDYWANSDRS